MSEKKLNGLWFVGGMLGLAYALCVLITGKFIFGTDNYVSLISDKETDPIGYYINLLGSGALGIFHLYRSLLFIPSNKKYYDEYPEYVEKRKTYFNNLSTISPHRILGVTIVVILLCLFAFFIIQISGGFDF
jgi:hypothetical protein